jgi:ribosomal protein L11 methyltransferase
MAWKQLVVDVPDDLKDAIAGELAGNGVSGIWETEAPDPGHTRLVIYVDSRSDVPRIEDRIRSIFRRSELTNPSISSGVVEDRDWSEEWKKSYVSFPIGDDFFLIPSWEDVACPEERLPIRIDPGRAFGTGTHETTQLSIEAIERWVDSDELVLDLGSGSGILAIASRLLGARQVVACDGADRGLVFRNRPGASTPGHRRIVRDPDQPAGGSPGSSAEFRVFDSRGDRARRVGGVRRRQTWRLSPFTLLIHESTETGST